MSLSPALAEEIRNSIRDVPDFPKPGVLFRDITPLLSNPKLFRKTVDALAESVGDLKIDTIVAIEARGFVFGSALAYKLGCAFVPVRKAGKLPFGTIQEAYALEYGSATIEIHSDAISNGCNVLIHDDLLATGGTAMAAGRLIQGLGGHIAGFSFLINLSFLHGEDTIMKHFELSPRYLLNYME